MDYDDFDDNLGVDIFAAIREAVGTSEVKQAWSQVKSPLPAIKGVSGVSKPVLPSWLTQFGTPISTLAKTIVSKAKAQPTTAPETTPQGETIVPRAGAAPPSGQEGMNPLTILVGLGLAGAAVYLIARRR